MVISLSPPGVRCQVGDLVMLVDPASDRKANLILKTKATGPLGFPLPPETVAGPGEYEISGIRVKGLSVGQGTVYRAILEGVHLVFLGALPADKTLEGSLGVSLEKLGAADILFLSHPSGSLKQIITLIKQVAPKVIVPTDDKTAKLLAEELGQKVKAEEKLVVKKKDLDKEEGTNKLVWLKS